MTWRPAAAKSLEALWYAGGQSNASGRDETRVGRFRIRAHDRRRDLFSEIVAGIVGERDGVTWRREGMRSCSVESRVGEQVARRYWPTSKLLQAIVGRLPWRFKTDVCYWTSKCSCVASLAFCGWMIIPAPPICPSSPLFSSKLLFLGQRLGHGRDLRRDSPWSQFFLPLPYDFLSVLDLEMVDVTIQISSSIAVRFGGRRRVARHLKSQHNPTSVRHTS